MAGGSGDYTTGGSIGGGMHIDISTLKDINFSFKDRRKADAVHSVCSNLRLKKFYKYKFCSIKKSIHQHYLFYKKNFKS